MELLIVVGIASVGILFMFIPALIKADTRRKRATNPRYQPPGSLGVIDEVFHPSAYSAFAQLEAEQRTPAPAPLPGEPLKG